MLLQFSSAQGPEECCIAVEKTLNYFLTVTEQRQVDVINGLYTQFASTFYPHHVVENGGLIQR